MNFRPYQTRTRVKIWDSFKNGVRRVIMCSPTGSGKTVIFSDIAIRSLQNGFNVIIVVDRKELLEQAYEKVTQANQFIAPEIIGGGSQLYNRPTFQKEGEGTCYIATVQTLIRKKESFFAQFGRRVLLIIDEAHKQSFDRLFTIDEFKPLYIIGATATPYRTGKMRQLSALYEEIITVTTIKKLISDGYLVPSRSFGADIDLSEVKMKGNEYDPEALYNMFSTPELYEGVVDKYQQFAAGTSAICFCVNVEHSKKTMQAFINAGIRAAHLDGKDGKRKREQIIRDFKRGIIKVLCNCDILTTGFDYPALETVIVNRATASLPLWLQMCGRGSRPAPGKNHFKIIDMGGNIFRHGFWEAQRKYKLNHSTSKRKGVAPVKSCPKCLAINHASAAQCCECHYTWPKKERKTILAEFEEINNESFYDESPADVLMMEIKDMTLEQLEQYRKMSGYKQGWIIRQIIAGGKFTIAEYAALMDYAEAWVQRMTNYYRKELRKSNVLHLNTQKPKQDENNEADTAPLF